MLSQLVTPEVLHGAARMALFFKAGIFSNLGGGLTFSFTAAKDEERWANLPVFSSLRLCHLSGLIIFDGGGYGYGCGGGPRTREE